MFKIHILTFKKKRILIQFFDYNEESDDDEDICREELLPKV